MQVQALRKEALSKVLNVKPNDLEYFDHRNYHHNDQDYLVLTHNESEIMFEHEMNKFIKDFNSYGVNEPESLEKTAKILNHISAKQKMRLYGKAHAISGVSDVEHKVNVGNQDFCIYEV